MNDATQFLSKHGLWADDIDTLSVLSDFKSEMDEGLGGNASSLKMIPAFVSADRALPIDEPVIVIDAGGTNLRIAVISFNGEGKPCIENIEKHQMPGVEKELSADEFYKMFSDYLAPVIDRSDKIGFCFSYPAEIYPDCDGKLLHWVKDIKVPEVVGQFIGKSLMNAMGEVAEDKSIVLLNDTVATLLAGKASGGGKNYSSYIGFILGTGTNTAYIEKNANITKCDNLDSSGSQTINVESGNYSLAPRGDIDAELDGGTMDPGVHTFEKMISGLYRGKLILMIMKAAADEGLFSEVCSEYIRGIDEVSAYDVDMYLLGKGEGPLVSDKIVGADADMLTELINGVYSRCAKLTALNISAAVLQSGGGTDPEAPVCINIDGSRYYKSVGFQDMVESFLKEILGARGVSYELMHVDEAPLIGAAVGGLVS